MTINQFELEQFRKDGYLNLAEVADVNTCLSLLSNIKAEQDFSPNIFMDESEFVKCPQYKGVNPRPGFNMLEQFSAYAGQLESTPRIVNVLSSLLGDDYYILNKKVICGVPEAWIPKWVMERIKDNSVNNLGAYIRPQYRNITYFYGIDFHQDIIDYPNRDADFITLYIYLHEVDARAAPLNILPATHLAGADIFPHDLERTDRQKNEWLYTSGLSKKEMVCNQLTITGGVGSVALWHGLTLHGTAPNCGDEARISLRYLIAKQPNKMDTFLDRVNADISPLQFDSSMRLDLDGEGQSKLKNNYLYSQYKDRQGF